MYELKRASPKLIVHNHWKVLIHNIMYLCTNTHVNSMLVCMDTLVK